MNVCYDRHDIQWERSFSDPERIKVSQSWLKDDNLGSLFNDWMRDVAAPLIQARPGSSWLTVGDGRYGSDAHYLIKHGVKAHASDMYPTLLSKGSEMGFIHDFSAQNAEALTFETDAFDHVFCKDTLHHCPRPFVAIYEMLRVARDSVVLLEPLETHLRLLPQCVRLIKGRGYSRYIDEFEEVGNYIYGLNERDITRLCTGIGLTTCAFKPFSVCYSKGIEFIPIKGGSFTDAMSRMKFHLGQGVRRGLATTGLYAHNMLCTIIFKSALPDVYPALAAKGFQVQTLPKNPHRLVGSPHQTKPCVSPS